MDQIEETSGTHKHTKYDKLWVKSLQKIANNLNVEVVATQNEEKAGLPT